MDRERGDETPFQPWKQPGQTSRFTRTEIETIRELHSRWNTIRAERNRLCKTLGISSDVFNKVAAGVLGKKPRPE